MKLRFFKCDHCGNEIMMVVDKGVPVICCGQKMTELVPGTSDGAVEKHVPEVSVAGKNVDVVIGSVEHPMVEGHYIEWIAIETTKGSQIKTLKPGDAPKASFVLSEDEELVSVFEYCNLHGLWKKD